MGPTTCTAINAQQWSRVKDLFHRALEREGPDRTPFVRAGSAGDAVVCAEVERLLAAHVQAEGFIERARGSARRTWMSRRARFVVA